MNIVKILWSNLKYLPKCFRTFLIEEINSYFRIFKSDLGIRESFENATPNSTIRHQNLPLKKLGFFEQIFGSSRIPKVGWWMICPLSKIHFSLQPITRSWIWIAEMKEGKRAVILRYRNPKNKIYRPRNPYLNFDLVLVLEIFWCDFLCKSLGLSAQLWRTSLKTKIRPGSAPIASWLFIEHIFCEVLHFW